MPPLAGRSSKPTSTRYVRKAPALAPQGVVSATAEDSSDSATASRQNYKITLASAAAKGTLFGVGGFLLLLLGVWMKARSEERWLAQELDQRAYSHYRKRVPMPMLIPFPTVMHDSVEYCVRQIMLADP
jgi:hypothetical protein